MTPATAFLLGVLAGEAVAVAAVVYARHAARRIIEAAHEEPEPVAVAVVAAQPAQATRSFLDADPFTVLPMLAALEEEVSMPVVDDGVFLGVLHLDARHGETTSREIVATETPPEGMD